MTRCTGLAGRSNPGETGAHTKTPSADAILLALRAIREGSCPPDTAARSLFRAAASDSGDDVMEMRRMLERESSTLPLDGGLPVHCPDCRSVFRVRLRDLDERTDCPLCRAALVFPTMAHRTPENSVTRRAAEAEPAYVTAGRQNDTDRFAHFELLCRLGEGGAGRVWRARNRRTEREVALKVCRFSPVERQAASWRRALREVEGAALDHPRIVRIFDAGLAEGRPYVEMEFVPGGSARERGRFPLEKARQIFVDVLSALSVAHRECVVHRDLKPANVLLDTNGRAKVGDFGLCKLLNETSSTTTGKIVGSPHFMAPEQWTDGRIGPYTDVYAAGLLFYFLLTGSLPYEANDPLSIMYKHLHFELPDPRERAGNVPATLVTFLRKATARKPADRFADAEECRKALEKTL